MTDAAPVIYRPLRKRISSRLAVLGGLVLALTVGAVLLWPNFAVGESGAYLISANRAANAQDRELDLKLALWLKPNDPEANLMLVKLYLSQGRGGEATPLLKRAGSGAEAGRIRLMISLEADREDQAASAATDLLRVGNDAGDRLLAVLVYAAAGDKAAADSAIALLEPSEALQRAKRARASYTGLGIELAASGLPNSAERFLVKQPASFVRDATLGDISTARGGQANLTKARDYYSAALTFKPDSIAVRQKLAATLTALGDTAAATAQQKLIAKLQSGRP